LSTGFTKAPPVRSSVVLGYTDHMGDMVIGGRYKWWGMKLDKLHRRKMG